jgi:hypothetical protein
MLVGMVALIAFGEYSGSGLIIRHIHDAHREFFW